MKLNVKKPLKSDDKCERYGFQVISSVVVFFTYELFFPEVSLKKAVLRVRYRVCKCTSRRTGINN